MIPAAENRAYGLYTLAAIALLIFLWIAVRETKGKTLGKQKTTDSNWNYWKQIMTTAIRPSKKKVQTSPSDGERAGVRGRCLDYERYE
jgi:hypothetical protein